MMAWIRTLLPLALLASLMLGGPVWAEELGGLDDELSLLDDIPLDDLVEVEPEPSAWLTIGGPIALVGAGVALMLMFVLVVPFKVSKTDILIYHLPTGIKRGFALAAVFYGVAFAFGGLEVHYQMQMHGSAEQYFANMSDGKIIAFTHAHLFGFTTSFLIIGVPFSLQFSHLRWYQALLPIGLTASAVDVASWWGIKYISINFEWVSIICAVFFTISYVGMLIGLLRVILFPSVIWASDKDSRKRAVKLAQARDARTQDQ